MIMELSNDFMRALQLDTVKQFQVKAYNEEQLPNVFVRQLMVFYVLPNALHNGHSTVNDIYDPP